VDKAWLNARSARPATNTPPGEEDIPKVADLIVHYDTEVGGCSDFTEEDLREMNRPGIRVLTRRTNHALCIG
jgi:hypothetical protein